MRELLAAFTVWGEPKPKERARVGKGHGYTPKATRDAESAVIEAFKTAHPLFVPTVETITLEADFYRKGKRKVDADNLLKLTQDALNKVAFVDDEQICELTGRRFYGAGVRARTEVRIYLAEEAVTS